jgi:hypothetical protein
MPRDQVFSDDDGLWVRDPLGNCRPFDINDYEALAHIAECARRLIVEGLRLTPDGLIVREKADKSDPHYALCVALEDVELIPSCRRAAR